MKIYKDTLFFMFIVLCGCTTTNKCKNDGLYSVSNVSMDSSTYPVVVLGGGVGGLTASIYLSQAGLNPLVIEGDMPGGLITQSNCVENWPGEIKISGSELASKIKLQATKSGVKILNKRISSVDFSEWPYKIKICDITTDKSKEKEIKALSCIIVMGSKPNILDIPGISGTGGYFGKGVSTCAVCDGAFYKDKVVAVVGGGNAAVAESLYLSNFVKKVYIIIRSDKFKAHKHEQNLVSSKPNIEVLFNSKVEQVLGDGKKVTSLIIEDTKADLNATNAVKELMVDGLFLAIGSTPNTKLFEKQLALDENGFIKKIDYQETSKHGIYTAGDISDNRFKQAITAAGDATKAALQAIEFLQKAGYSSQKKTQKEQTQEIKQDESSVIEITSKKQFDKIILDAGDKTVVIDFFGTYCIPCKNMAPFFEKLARNYTHKAIFVKIDISKHMDIAQQFEIQSVPTFLFIEDEEVSQQIVGTRSYEFLENALIGE